MILLTAMEYMRDEVQDKEEVPTKKTKRQKGGKTGNWTARIKTFGKKDLNYKDWAVASFSFREEGFAWICPHCWVGLCHRCL